VVRGVAEVPEIFQYSFMVRALVAGVVIGVSEAITMAVTAPGWAPLVSFTLLILVLLLKPERV